MKYLLAADTGGTFTDVVVHDSVSGRTEFGKRLTNYENLVAGVTEGLVRIAVGLEAVADLQADLERGLT